MIEHRNDLGFTLDMIYERRRSAIERLRDTFDIAAHLDLIERNPALRGSATESHYRHVAEAFEDSRTITELNAGRVLGNY